jgi:hypothetical protein
MQLDKAEAHLGPDAITTELMERMKRVRATYDNLATWEVTSLSLEDTDAMLGVLMVASSSGDDEFRWKSCPGLSNIPPGDRIPKIMDFTPEHDSPAFMSLVDTLSESPVGALKAIDTPESILDDSLRQGGSSFKALRNDISVKEAESAAESVTGSEASSETGSTASNTRTIMEKTPWAPPHAGHAASRQLIQRVSVRLKILETF